MGSVYLITRSRNGKKIQYRVIKYKLHGKWVPEILGKVEQVSKGMAKEILKERERIIKRGEYGLIENEIPPLSVFSEKYIEYQKNVKQKRSWKKDAGHLKRWNTAFGIRKLTEISAKDIDDYKQKRLVEVKPSTVNRELEVLRHLFYLAKRWKKFFGENPVSESGLLSVNNQMERILTLEEEERLLACSAEHLKPIITAALNTGMRKGEILSLTWEDIDFENNLITVRHTVSKSRKARRLPINSTLRKALLEQKLKTSHSGYVFLTPDGNPYSPNNPNALKRAFGMACKRANIKSLRFHDLRHTAATRMVESGASIVAVSKILGHADLKTTMRYTHPENSLKDAVEKLGNFRTNFSQDLNLER